MPSRRSVLLLGAVSMIPGTAHADSSDPWHRVPHILRRIRPPRFPARKWDITAFGAAGDGVTDCTAAFRRAIAACHRAGGGRVLVPPGRFLTGAVHLRSGVELHVSEGATIAFSTDPNAYLPVVFTRWEGTECYNYSPFIYARGQRDVAITGKGTLDGQARQGPWESWYAGGGPQGADQRALRKMGDDGVPVEQRVFGAGHYLRPAMIQFVQCENILVSDVTILEPAMWTVNPVLSRNITIRRITVVSTLYNTDGCDPEASSYVHIHDCRFNTNDDCVAVKSGRDADGRRVGVPSENIVVQDCLFSGRWGGITVGSEMSGGVRHVFAERCVVNSPAFPGNHPVKYPVYIKASKKRGAYVDGVHVRGFTGSGVDREIIFVNMNYASTDQGTLPVSVRNITMRDTRIDGADAVLNLVGLETDHLTDVRLDRCRFTGITGPDKIAFTDGLRLRKVFVNGVEV
ncbi:glycoside hydrolase family 28 protein [Nonomuraea sp. NPDC059023]|uniref:glycoside hydrolase family 28 protein n=1 Tax=Nonomuraea sp. NPDC059023 TaxID=3346706 RepID=UPI0036C455E5